MEIRYYGDKISERIAKTPEGFLICQDVPISRTGYQEYLASELMENPTNGHKIIPVYRPAKEVFDIRSLASFEGKPVTNEHPDEDVTPENYQRYSCGHVQNVHVGEGEDANKVLADLYITDPGLIRLIEDGKREISCGYYAEEKKDETGRLCQTHIRGNHVAVVRNGRAGKHVCIRDKRPSVLNRQKRKNSKLSLYGNYSPFNKRKTNGGLSSMYYNDYLPRRGRRYLVDEDILEDEDELLEDEDEILEDDDYLEDEDEILEDDDYLEDEDEILEDDEDVIVDDDEDVFVEDEDEILEDDDYLEDEDELVEDGDFMLHDAGVKGMKKGQHIKARNPEYVESLRGGGGRAPGRSGGRASGRESSGGMSTAKKVGIGLGAAAGAAGLALLGHKAGLGRAAVGAYKTLRSGGGLKNAMRGAGSEIASSSRVAAGNAANAIKSAPGRAREAASNAVKQAGKLKGELKQFNKERKEAGLSVGQMAANSARYAGGAVASGAKRAGSAVASGAKRAGSAVASGAKRAGSAVRSGANKTLSAISPKYKYRGLDSRYWDRYLPYYDDDEIILNDEELLEDEDELLEDDDLILEDEDELLEDDDVIVEDEDELLEDEDEFVEDDEDFDESAKSVIQDAKSVLRDAKRYMRRLQLRDAIILNDDDLEEEESEPLTDEDILEDEDYLEDEDELLEDEDEFVEDEDEEPIEDDEDIIVEDDDEFIEDGCHGDEDVDVLEDDEDELVNTTDEDEAIDTDKTKALREITEASRGITDPNERKQLQDAIYKALCGKNQMADVMRITKKNRSRMDAAPSQNSKVDLNQQQSIYDSFNPHKKTSF